MLLQISFLFVSQRRTIIFTEWLNNLKMIKAPQDIRMLWHIPYNGSEHPPDTGVWKRPGTGPPGYRWTTVWPFSTASKNGSSTDKCYLASLPCSYGREKRFQ